MHVSISIPGSKSIANRALVLAHLSRNKTKFKNLPNCTDVTLMQKALKSLNKAKINTGDAGTTTRFITALATLQNRKITIDGTTHMRKRPIRPLITALNGLGAKVTSKTGCPPLTIHPKVPTGGQISLPGNISSQYLSALLMIAPTLEKETIINIEQKLCSTPYIDLTLEIMKDFGIKVTNKNYKQFKIKPQKITPQKTLSIEPDASSASYIGAFAAFHPKTHVLLKGLNKNSIQGDISFLKHLKKMGCLITQKPTGTLIQGPKKLKSLGKIDMNETPDLVMTFAILAIFTEGKTTIKNIENLRIKETDRLKALKTELTKIGIKVKTTKNSITIIGDPNLTPKKTTIETYNDHRIAMSFAIANTRLHTLIITNPTCVQKSYTQFWDDLAELNKTSLILIGLRGSGKTKLGKMISKYTNRQFIDTDQEIEKQIGMKIHEFVEQNGWRKFRDIERKVISETTKRDNTVISTGGGAVLCRHNTKNLQKSGFIVYLHRHPKTCAKYIENNKDRPPLTNKVDIEEEMKELYKTRNKTYKKVATLTFKRTENLEENALQIIKAFDEA